MTTFMALLLCLFSSALLAQDQLMIRVNQTGILSVMESALEYNQRGQGRTGFQVPAGLYDFKVKRADLQANPIVRILQEVSNVDLNRDLPFYLYNSVVNVDGGIDKASLRTAVSNYTAQGFDLKITFAINKLSLRANELSLCENKRGRRCGNGLKATFRNSTVALRSGSRINAEANFKVDTTSTQAKMRLVRVTSNLNTRNGPRIDINIGSVVVPPISIIINGQEAQLDTSNLRAEIMARKEFLANKLLEFSAEFIAEDLSEMVNKALKNQCLPTQLRIIEIANQDVPAPRGGFRSQPYVIAADNTRVVRPRIDYSIQSPSVFPGDNRPAPTFMELLQRDLASIIKSANFDLSLKSIRSPLNQDIEIRANGSFVMNNRRWRVLDTVGNSTRKLPALNVDTIINRQDHFAVVLGEPVVNASMDLLQGMGVFQKVLEAQGKIGGVSVNSIKLHFKSGATAAQDRLFAIGNLKVKLREIDADGIMGWVKRAIAVWLERNNNNAILNFPVQFEVIPRFATQRDGSVKLFLSVNSPFVNPTTLKNDYNYPNNVVSATKVVQESIVEILKENMGEYVNREFEFPLDQYLNMNGVSLQPKRMSMLQSGYLLVAADIKKIDFAKLNQSPSGASCQ